MKVTRLITYEFTSEEALDAQMGKSLPDGVKILKRLGEPVHGTIRVLTLRDDRRTVNCFPGVEMYDQGTT